MRYYVDTCIWIDYFEERRDFNGRPIGAYAAAFFGKVMREKHTVLYSSIVIRELLRYYDRTYIQEKLRLLFMINLKPAQTDRSNRN